MHMGHQSIKLLNEFLAGRGHSEHLGTSKGWKKLLRRSASIPDWLLIVQKNELRDLKPVLMTFGPRDLIPGRDRAHADLLMARDQNEEGRTNEPETHHANMKAQQVTKILWTTAATSTRRKYGGRGTSPGPTEEPHYKTTYFWSALQDDERVAENKIKIILLGTPLQARFNMPCSKTRSKFRFIAKMDGL